MDIKSIKQTLSASTAQPLVELVKLISARNVRSKLNILINRVTVTTVNEFICRYENLPLRQVVITAGDISIELRFNTLLQSIDINALDTLSIMWDNDGGQISVNLQDIFSKMGDIAVNTQLVEVMRFYNKLGLSKHGISVEYGNYLYEGDEVSELSVIIDGITYSKSVRHEQVDYDDELACEYSYLTGETPHLLLLKFMDDLESFNFLNI